MFVNICPMHLSAPMSGTNILIIDNLFLDWEHFLNGTIILIDIAAKNIYKRPITDDQYY